MYPSNIWSKISRHRNCLVLVAFFAVSTPFVLQTIQTAREAARRSEISGGRDPADDFKMLMAMREIYPIVPLGDRLRRHSGIVLTSDFDQSSPISFDAEQLLFEHEDASRQLVSHYRLSRLHDDTYAEFIKQNGFGIGRMWFGMSWDEMRIQEPVPPPIPIEESTHDATSVPLFQPSAADLMYLPSLHSRSVLDFVSPRRLGVVPFFEVVSTSVSATGMNDRMTKDWSRIPADSLLHPLSVGHTEHAMTSEVKTSFRERLLGWQLSRLELVSLLKFPQPRVYLSNQLPNMNELNGAPTRPMEDFEETGLQKLREGEHVVIEANEDEMRMLGGIRAAKLCITCHATHRKALLGAFSYSLKRSQATPFADP